MTNISIPQNIIKDLGLQDLPEEKQTELLNSMTESVLKRIAIMVLEHLSEPDQEEFAKIREANDPQKIDEFLKAKIPDYEKKLQEIVEEFKTEIKNNIANLNK